MNDFNDRLFVIISDFLKPIVMLFEEIDFLDFAFETIRFYQYIFWDFVCAFFNTYIDKNGWFWKCRKCYNVIKEDKRKLARSIVEVCCVIEAKTVRILNEFIAH